MQVREHETREAGNYLVVGNVEGLKRKPVSVFDIDNVLVDSTRRREAALEELGYTPEDLEDPVKRRRFWDTFLSPEYMYLDVPVKRAVRLLHSRTRRYAILIVTGRPETLLEETLSQLRRFRVKFDALVFRGARCFLRDYEYKRTVLQGLGFRFVDEAHDDSLRVVEMYRDIVLGTIYWWREVGSFVQIPSCLVKLDGQVYRLSDPDLPSKAALRASLAGKVSIEWRGRTYIARSPSEAEKTIRIISNMYRATVPRVPELGEEVSQPRST